MNLHFEQVERALNAWHKNIVKRENIISKASGGVQMKTRKVYPGKVKNAIIATLKIFTQTIMFGSRFASYFGYTNSLTISESDYLSLTRLRAIKNQQ